MNLLVPIISGLAAALVTHLLSRAVKAGAAKERGGRYWWNMGGVTKSFRRRSGRSRLL